MLKRAECAGFGGQCALVTGGASACNLLAELCVLRTFGSPQIPLVFICPQSVPAFPWDRLGASIEFPVIPKRAQYAQFGCYSVYSVSHSLAVTVDPTQHSDSRHNTQQHN